MKRTLLAVGAVLSLVLATSLARAQGTFPLHEEDMKGPTNGLSNHAMQILGPQPARPESVKSLPAGAKGKPAFYVARVAGRQMLLVLYGTRAPKVYADVRGDGDLSGQKPLETLKGGQRSPFGEAASSFGPVSVPVPQVAEGAMARFCVSVLETGRDPLLVVFPAVIRSGSIELNGASHRLSILDADLDGRYDEVFSPSGRGSYDWLGLDSPPQFGPRGEPGMGATMPLPRLMPVGDAYYSLKVQPDGSSVTLAKAEPALGVLDLGGADAELTLYSDCGVHQLEGHQGRWELPEGTYQAIQLSLSLKDGKGTRWTLSSTADTGKLKEFVIRGGSTMALQIGPPLTLTTEASQTGGAVSITAVVTGQAGEHYSPNIARGGATGDLGPPTLKVLNASGKVVASGSFQYG